MSSIGKLDDYIVLDQFALRQFKGYKQDSSISTSQTIDYDVNQFVDKINNYYKQNNTLVDGYASFCKHIFIPNFIDNLTTGYTKIDDSNKQYLISDYLARTEYELPVLTRWFDKQYVNSPVAEYLDIILYSREQICIENKATQQHKQQNDNKNPTNNNDNIYNNGKWQWGIISIKPQLGNKELPMLPITIVCITYMYYKQYNTYKCL